MPDGGLPAGTFFPEEALRRGPRRFHCGARGKLQPHRGLWGKQGGLPCRLGKRRRRQRLERRLNREGRQQFPVPGRFLLLGVLLFLQALLPRGLLLPLRFLQPFLPFPPVRLQGRLPGVLQTVAPLWHPQPRGGPFLRQDGGAALKPVVFLLVLPIFERGNPGKGSGESARHAPGVKR